MTLLAHPVIKYVRWLITFFILLSFCVLAVHYLVVFSLVHFQSSIEHRLNHKFDFTVNASRLSVGGTVLFPTVIVDRMIISDNDQKFTINQLETQINIVASLLHRIPVFRSTVIDHLTIETGQLRYLDMLTGDQKKHLNLLPWLLLQGNIEIISAYIHLSGDVDLSVTGSAIKFDTSSEQHMVSGALSLIDSVDDPDTLLEPLSFADSINNPGVLFELMIDKNNNIKGFVNALEQDIMPFIPSRFSTHIKKLQAQTLLSFDINNGHLSHWEADMQVANLLFDNGLESFAVEGSVQLLGDEIEGVWHTWINHTLLGSGSQQVFLPFNRSRLSVSPKQNLWQIGFYSSKLSFWVKFLEQFVLLPDFVKNRLKTMKPTGQIEQFSVVGRLDDWSEFDAQLTLNDASFESYKASPQLIGVNAQVQFNRYLGRVEFLDTNPSIHFNQLSSNPFTTDRLLGHLYWQITDSYWSIKGEGLSLDLSDQSQIRGGFSYRKPYKRSLLDSRLSMQWSINQASDSLVKQLIPDKKLSALYQWLTKNVLSADFTEGVLLLSDSKQTEGIDQIQLSCHFNHSHLQYGDDWPDINLASGQILMDNHVTRILFEQAQTLGGRLTKEGAEVLLQKEQQGLRLSVQAVMEGSAYETLSYMQETPLRDYVKSSFDDWRIHQGRILSHLTMKKALYEIDEPLHIEWQAQLNSVDLYLENMALNIENIQGEIAFDFENGLSSNGLSAFMLGGDVFMQIESEFQETGIDVHLMAEGHATVDKIKQWQPILDKTFISGSLDYQADLNIDSSKGVFVSINSDLLGATIDLPSPFALAKDDRRSFSLKADISKSDRRLTLALQDRLQATFMFAQTGFDQGSIYIQDAPVSPKTLTSVIRKHRQLSIEGVLTQKIDMDAWWLLLSSMSIDKNQNSDLAIDIAMQIEQPYFRQQAFGLTSVSVKNNESNWRLEVTNRLLSGTVRIESGQPADIHLDYLRMKSNGFNGSPSFLSSFNPNKLPESNISIDEWYWGVHNLGQWQAELRQLSNKTRIHVIKAQFKKMQAQGVLIWWKNNKGSYSQWRDWHLMTDDIAQVQSSMHQLVVLKAKQSDVKVNLEWQGAPWQFNASTLQGDIDLMIKKGSLVDHKDYSPWIRPFRLVNIHNITRRLRLDFSNILSSDWVFDTLQAKINIDDGVATLTHPFSIQGTGIKIQSSGTFDLTNRSLDQQLVVTFPVVSHLPWMAILAGFSPQIVGAMYITEKLVGDNLERFSSVKYTLKGIWNDPKLKLNQVFDNDLDIKPKKTFKDRLLDILK